MMIMMMIYVDADAVTESTLGIDGLVLLTSAAIIVPLSYVLWIATVPKRTLAMDRSSSGSRIEQGRRERRPITAVRISGTRLKRVDGDLQGTWSRT